jgi:hypothetical protein
MDQLGRMCILCSLHKNDDLFMEPTESPTLVAEVFIECVTNNVSTRASNGSFSEGQNWRGIQVMHLELCIVSLGVFLLRFNSFEPWRS